MNTYGKLIVMESGTDASGKATQTDLLYNRLHEENFNVRKVDFPDYNSESSGLVKMYLRGDFGRRAEDVNPYVASAFFAVDRFASYAKEWRSFYQNNGIVLANRYTTSNMVHQGAKIADRVQRQIYLHWLEDLEFKKMGLPKPDIVFFLHVPPEVSIKLMLARRKNGQLHLDIHEDDKEHLFAAYYNACEVAELNKWHFVECTDQGNMRSIEEIHEEIYQKTLAVIK